MIEKKFVKWAALAALSIACIPAVGQASLHYIGKAPGAITAATIASPAVKTHQLLAKKTTAAVKLSTHKKAAAKHKKHPAKKLHKRKAAASKLSATAKKSATKLSAKSSAKHKA